MAETIKVSDDLEAVNTMLSVIGESPQNSLDDNLSADAVIALSTLTETMKAVQSEGWHWNIEHDYPLVPDATTNQISVPTNLVSFDLNWRRHGRKSFDPVVRGSRLYDRLSHTYEFTQTVYGTIKWLLPFTEMPEPAKRYVTIKAARIFQQREAHDGEGRSFTANDEARARATLIGDDLDTRQSNLFTDDPEMAWTTRSNIPLWRHR